MPKYYESSVEWATNHWSIDIQGIDFDETGQRIFITGNHPRVVYLYPNGDLLSILAGGNPSREELIQWEDNLRQLLKNEQQKESQQSGAGYSPQSVGSPDP